MNWKELRAVLVLTLGLTIFSSLLMGHHGTSNYDRDHPVTLTGTVTEYQFINPHVLIHFEVKNADGATETWLAEAAPPQRLFRAGWRTDSMKPGDKITVTGFPMKDGVKTLGLRKLTTADGKELSQGE